MNNTTIILPISPGTAEAMKSTGVWQDACPVPLSRLSLIKIRYLDFEGKEHDDGEMVSLDVVAEPIAEMFQALFENRFPFKKIRPMHEYCGDDELSMQDNNTSCFCFRPIMYTNTVSVHSYGLAIDINPLQNPYLTIEEEKGIVTCHPRECWRYLNRNNMKPGMIEKILTTLSEYGFFEWGGRWTSPLDYQHIQPPRGLAELLMELTLDEGKKLLAMAVEQRPQLVSMPHGERLAPVLELYRRHKSEFFEKWISCVLSC